MRCTHFYYRGVKEDTRSFTCPPLLRGKKGDSTVMSTLFSKIRTNPATHNPFREITSPYQFAESFGIRRKVSSSTYVMPNFLEYPEAHSKLSSKDQMK